MTTIVVNNTTKLYLKQIKKRYEKSWSWKYDKLTWEEFMYLMTITLQEELKLGGDAFINTMQDYHKILMKK
tara:strand:- start:77 stop:289 length:213 start_codon:yes stop_codon:yes gene_type:complete